MFFVPHFGDAKVYEISIVNNPVFQILARTMRRGMEKERGGRRESRDGKKEKRGRAGEREIPTLYYN